MTSEEIKEKLLKASVEVEINGRKYLAIFESDFDKLALELSKEKCNHTPNEKIGETKLYCCNICGKRTEEF